MTPRAPRGGIVVRLTVPEWNAIVTTVGAQLESLTPADWASGIHDDLKSGLDAMVDARKRKAARRKAALEAEGEQA